MKSLDLLVSFDLIINGFFAGMCFDVAFVKLPSRKIIGAAAYGHFAKNNDLGNGLKVYPYFFILSLLMSFVTVIVVYFNDQDQSSKYLLCFAAFASLAVGICTLKAGRVMWSLRKSQDGEKVLTYKLNRFAFWHSFRTAFQISAFILICLALAR